MFYTKDGREVKTMVGLNREGTLCRYCPMVTAKLGEPSSVATVEKSAANFVNYKKKLFNDYKINCDHLHCIEAYELYIDLMGVESFDDLLNSKQYQDYVNSPDEEVFI